MSRENLIVNFFDNREVCIFNVNIFRRKKDQLILTFHKGKWFYSKYQKQNEDFVLYVGDKESINASFELEGDGWILLESGMIDITKPTLFEDQFKDVNITNIKNVTADFEFFKIEFN